MQRLDSPQQECAREILDVVPLVMRGIRKQLRKHRLEGLSVPQFRTLLFINRNKGASLSDLAEHIGLTLPTMSTLVDGLVIRNFVVRRTHQDDRRRMSLMLTERGETTLQKTHERTLSYLIERIKPFSESERASIVKAMLILRQVFSEEVA